MREQELKAALEWAEAFLNNMKDVRENDSAPKEILLAISALRILTQNVKDTLEGKLVKSMTVDEIHKTIINIKGDRTPNTIAQAIFKAQRGE